MISEFPIKWDGFTASEKCKLQKLWSGLHFPAEFCANFAGEVSKGEPGQPGFVFIQANELEVFRNHLTLAIDEYASLEHLVEAVQTTADRFWESVRDSADLHLNR